MKTAIVTTLKRQATRILGELAKDHDPVLITEYGRPAGYLVDVESFELQRDRLRILEGMAKGERAIEEGGVLSEEQAKARMGCRMTTSDKLRALEDIWGDLQRTPEEVPSPSWHADVLHARERRVKEGTAQFGDWAEAKCRIRERAK